MSRKSQIVLAVAAIGLVALFVAFRSSSEAAAPGRRPGGPRATPVRAALIEKGTLELRERYPGEILAHTVDLAPRVTGRIATVNVRLGDEVKRGQVVAKLDEADLRQQHRQALAAVRAAAASEQRVLARLEAARLDLQRNEPLAEKQLVSAQEIARLRAELGSLEAEAAAARAEAERGRAQAAGIQEQLSDLELRAPFDAKVVERLLEPGATASPATAVVRLVRSGPLEVQFRVPERDAALVRVGQAIRVRSQATGGDVFEGRVERVAGAIRREDRSLLVEGVITDESAVLRPGMFANVELGRRVIEDAFLLPAEAIVRRADRDGIFVVDGEELARFRAVEVRGEQSGVAAVAGELAEGESVLIFGHDDLADGSKVMVVERQGEAIPATVGEAE